MAALRTSGVTATWGTTAFGTVVELRNSYGGSLPLGRGASSVSLSSAKVSGVSGSGLTTVATSYTQIQKPWAVDVGTIEVLCLSTANVSLEQWGTKRVLAMGGTAFVGTSTTVTAGIQMTTMAVCQTWQAEAKVNDVWRFQGTFKISKEFN
jgi:hypothetical protein